MKRRTLLEHAFLIPVTTLRGVLPSAVLSSLIGATAYAQQLEIVDLRHRRADDILPVIEPMLQAGDIATGRDYTLFLRVAPARLEEIRRIVARLDAPQQQLLISVRQGGTHASDRSDVSARGTLGGRDAHVTNAPDLPANTVIVQGGARRDDVQEDIAQQVRTLDGEPAYIASGASRLLPRITTQRIDGATVITRGATEQNAVSGFYVLPRVSGDRVTLEVAAQREDFAGRGRTVNQGLITTVSGRVGEWIDLGGIDQQSERTTSGLLQSGRSSATSSTRLAIRVEVIGSGR